MIIDLEDKASQTFGRKISERFKTNNIYIDTILSLMFCYVIGFITRHSQYYVSMLTNYINFLFIKKYGLVLESNFDRWEGVLLSNDMMAVLYYINSRPQVLNTFHGIKNIKTKSFKSTDEMSLYFPITRTQSQLSDNINVCFKVTERETSGSKSNDSTSYEHYEIFISSQTKTTTDLKDFVKKCSLEFESYLEEEKKNHTFVFTLQDNEKKDEETLCLNSYSEFICDSNNKTVDSLFMEGKTELLSQVTHFIQNEDYYKKYGIPYHLGIGLFGKPGNGKTTFIKALLNYCVFLGNKRHIVSIDFNKITSVEQLHDIFYGDKLNNRKIPQRERLYVFEDFDTYQLSHDRELVTDIDIIEKLPKKLEELITKTDDKHSKSINLGNILNVLDGIIETPGRIIVMTSNHSDKIDPALLRPGRIDCHVDLRGARIQDIIDIIKFFYGSADDMSIRAIEKLNDYKLSIAKVVNICRSSITQTNAIDKIKHLVQS